MPVLRDEDAEGVGIGLAVPGGLQPELGTAATANQGVVGREAERDRPAPGPHGHADDHGRTVAAELPGPERVPLGQVPRLEAGMEGQLVRIGRIVP
jgi:hypothetical protein